MIFVRVPFPHPSKSNCHFSARCHKKQKNKSNRTSTTSTVLQIFFFSLPCLNLQHPERIDSSQEAVREEMIVGYMQRAPHIHVITCICSYEPPPREADLSHCGLYLRSFRLLSVPKNAGKTWKVVSVGFIFIFFDCNCCTYMCHVRPLPLSAG